MTLIMPSDRRKREAVFGPLRDAIEDYDDPALLERKGRAAEADAIMAPLASSFFAWDNERLVLRFETLAGAGWLLRHRTVQSGTLGLNGK